MSSCARLSNYFEKEKQQFQHRSGRSFSDISMLHVQSDLSAAACDICFSVRMRSMPSHVNFYRNAAISCCFLLCCFILFLGINTCAKNDPSFYANLEFSSFSSGTAQDGLFIERKCSHGEVRIKKRRGKNKSLRLCLMKMRFHMSLFFGFFMSM